MLDFMDVRVQNSCIESSTSRSERTKRTETLPGVERGEEISMVDGYGADPDRNGTRVQVHF